MSTTAHRRRRPTRATRASLAAGVTVGVTAAFLAAVPAHAAPSVPFETTLLLTAQGNPNAPGQLATSSPGSLVVAPDGDLIITSNFAELDVWRTTPTGDTPQVIATLPANPTDSAIFGNVAYISTARAVYALDLSASPVTTTRVVGTGNLGTPTIGGSATTENFRNIKGIAVDADGNLYLGDDRNHTIWRIDVHGTASTADDTVELFAGVVPGSGVTGTYVTNTPIAKETADLGYIDNLAVDSQGNVYFTSEAVPDSQYPVTRIDHTTGQVAWYDDANYDPNSGTGNGTPTTGPVANSQLVRPNDIAFDAEDNLYIADQTYIEKVTPDGDLSILTGDGNRTAPGSYPAVSAASPINNSLFIAAAPEGVVYTSVDGGIEKISALEPGRPTTPVATATNAQATLTWNAPTYTGAGPVTGYVVTPLRAGIAQTPVSFANDLGTTHTLTGLTNGAAYTFTVAALTASGEGLDSRLSNVVTPAAPVVPPAPNPAPAPVVQTPGAPTITAVTGAGTAATVSFTAPAYTGTTPITGYRVTVSGGDLTSPRTGDGTSSPITVGGLATGQTYSFTVTALNAAGTGVVSTSLTARWDAPVVPVAPGVTRLAGDDRVGTSVAVSKALFPTDGRATAAVIATSRTYADSIAGGRLASAVQGPLLLSDTAALQNNVADEIRRLVTPGGKVYILGDTNALSQQVRDGLAQLNSTYTITRVGGADRYETATAIADVVTGYTAKPDAPIYLASGTNFPDGLAVAALAGRTGGVVLLTDGTTLPAATKAWLQAHDPTGARTTTVGGPAAAAYPTAATSLVGIDRYSTAALVAQKFSNNATTVGIASGTNWPDALVGAAAMGIVGGPLMLTQPDVLTPTTASAIDANTTLTSSWLFGGPTTISTTAEGQLQQLLPKP